jgi:hypothetical protein
VVTVQVQAVVMDKGVDEAMVVIRAMGRVVEVGATAVEVEVAGATAVEVAVAVEVEVAVAVEVGVGVGVGMAWAKVVGLVAAGVAALEVGLVRVVMVEEMGMARVMVEA